MYSNLYEVPCCQNSSTDAGCTHIGDGKSNSFEQLQIGSSHLNLIREKAMSSIKFFASIEETYNITK